MLGVVDSKLKEIKNNDLKVGEQKAFSGKGGWAGYGERYWFSALIPDKQTENKVRFSRTGENTYQSDYVGAPIVVSQGGIGTNVVRLFAGAKEIALLDSYVKNLGIEKFDLAVDFGWYYFLTKPFFYILEFLYRFIGNMGWAILLFAALLRLAMFPIANKSYESMSKMKKVQPKIQAIQETYKDDKMRQQQELMELYKREKINPASGCLPMFIQIPVFFSLYKVLNIAIEIRHAPFVGWIKDLSAPDPMTLSAMTHLPIPAFLDLGVWPILMGVTMFLQQKLSPKPTNPDQARMFLLMPVVFTFMLGHFASGLVIYWTLSNVLSIIQQKAIMHKVGVN
jgi:YidC/Oxa1 family membrane protein insertase